MTIGWKVIDANNDSMVKTYIVDTEEYITSLPTKFLGSSAICISTGEVYMLNTEGVWKKIELDGSVPGGNGGDNPAVTDVQINGSSIVADGVADIPIANEENKYGITRFNSGYGIRLHTTENYPFINKAQPAHIDARTSNYLPIVPNNLDYAVKAAMCDEKGADWSDAEKLAARQRIGYPKLTLIEDVTLDESVYEFQRKNTPNGERYKFKRVVVVMTDILRGSGSVEYFFVRYFHDGNPNSINMALPTMDNTLRNSIAICDASFGRALCMSMQNTNLAANNAPWLAPAMNDLNTYVEDITGILIRAGNTSSTLGAGLRIRIYGAWA